MKNLPMRNEDRFPAANGNVNIERFLSTDDSPKRMQESRNKDDIQYYINVLLRHKWYVIVPVLIMVLAMVLLLQFEEPLYAASSRILIKNTTPRLMEIADLNGQEKHDVFYPTEYQLLQSEKNISEVITLLNLEDTLKKPWSLKSAISQQLRPVKAWAKGALSIILPRRESRILTAEEQAEIKRQETLAIFRDALSVTPQEGNQLVDIRIETLDPKQAARISNTLVEVYARNSSSQKLETATNAAEWLTKQASNLKKEMYASELALQQFRKKQDFVSLDLEEKNNIVLSNLNELNKKYNQAKTNRVDIENNLTNINSLSNTDIRNIDVIPPYIDDHLIKSIMSMRSKYLDVELEYINKSKSYRTRHPFMIELQSQLDRLTKAIAAEFQKGIRSLQTAYNLALDKEQKLVNQFEKQKSKTQSLNSDLITYNTLKLDANSFRELYLKATDRLREVKLTQASATKNVKIIQTASVPVEPIPSQAAIKLLGSMTFGGFLGVAIAFSLARFQTRFQEAEEVESFLQLPLIGVIPHYSADGRRGTYEPTTLHQHSLPAAEAYRVLRTRLQAITPQMHTLLVTSAVPSEGKSTTSANLGVAFARMGLNVLIVDTDLRRPSLHRHFWAMNSEGLSTVLTEGGEWQDLLQETPMGNLKILPTGVNTANASDLLSSREMKDLIQSFKREFDLVIFDAPLVLSLSDVEIVAPEMDGVLMVHCPHRCEKNSVLKAVQMLERANAPLLGIALNNVRAREEQYYYARHDYTPRIESRT